jgi:hypothetical protein
MSLARNNLKTEDGKKQRVFSSRISFMKAPKKFSFEWAFEPLQSHPTFSTKRMFGALAAYLMNCLVMVLSESPGERCYRGVDYPIEIWNGVLFPTEKEHHDTLRADFPSLIPHPVLGKWLYLPREEDNFEETVMKLGELIAQNDPRLGVPSVRKQ